MSLPSLLGYDRKLPNISCFVGDYSQLIKTTPLLFLKSVKRKISAKIDKLKPNYCFKFFEEMFVGAVVFLVLIQNLDDGN